MKNNRFITVTTGLAIIVVFARLFGGLGITIGIGIFFSLMAAQIFSEIKSNKSTTKKK
jgi:hypothetical protein